MHQLKTKGGNRAIPGAFHNSFFACEETDHEETDYDAADMEAFLDNLGTLLIQTASYVMKLRDVFAELAYDERCSEEETNEQPDHDVLIISPSGIPEITDSQDCKERFPWFDKVSVFEPVPGCKNLFITCDADNMKIVEDKKYLIGPGVVINMDDNPEQEGTVTLEDALFTLSSLANRFGFLVDEATGEKNKAICIS